MKKIYLVLSVIMLLLSGCSVDDVQAEVFSDLTNANFKTKGYSKVVGENNQFDSLEFDVALQGDISIGTIYFNGMLYELNFDTGEYVAGLNTKKPYETLNEVYDIPEDEWVHDDYNQTFTYYKDGENIILGDSDKYITYTVGNFTTFEYKYIISYDDKYDIKEVLFQKQVINTNKELARADIDNYFDNEFEEFLVDNQLLEKDIEFSAVDVEYLFQNNL